MSVINWDEVDLGLVGAKGIAFDTCHKIYVLMDDEQLEEMRRLEYDEIRSAEEMSHDEMLATLKEWFAKSCALKFIQAVETNHDDPNAGYTTLIEQGARETEPCEICDEEWCAGQCDEEDEDEEDEDEDY